MSNGNSSYSYSWTGPDGYTSSQKDPTISNASSSDDGTYTVTITTDCGGVSYVDPVNVTVHSEVTPTVTNPGPICSGGSFTLPFNFKL